MKDITLLIPAKFEKESLPSVLEDLEKFNCKKLIILKKNDTATIQAISKFKKYILYQNGNGYGNALIEGINKTKTKYFCIFNADGSFQSKELPYMYNLISKGNKLDFIFASRYEKNASSEDDTFVTSIGNFFFTKLGYLLFQLTITDILYTFVVGKTFKAKQLKLNSQDFTFCVELPIKAKRSGMQLISCPSHEKKRIAGKKKVSALKDGFLILKYMIFSLFNK